VLKGGRTLAKGPLAEVVTSEILSDAYELDLIVEERASRYTARLA
jgi:ABC-type cobalamin/Fe3+-siderophores transport system ATPase subunit